MSVAITAMYAAIFGLALVILGVSVFATRIRKRIEHGDDGDNRLRRLIRIHGNFAEYVPLALVLMLILELNGSSSMYLHSLGIALIVARVLHVVGMMGERDVRIARGGAAVMTSATIATASFSLLRQLLA